MNLITLAGAGHGLRGATPEENARIVRRAAEWIRTYCD